MTSLEEGRIAETETKNDWAYRKE